ncbi:hypothetical protein [Desulfuribacillus alkaliarsenatis]|uniref:Uncharacterized protein n=1 Tax=Desulfuribacillus alkaliarsenatis TaxID=766136 RepID=A0A1E5G1M0_9FIRM|nr:hypothetical protein [Desulfuribacillus alkaliarsenatis]OEF96807.1 hypothetical protein BHF68_07015 [Desulfuribacillus alkaliarsenatis]
MKEPTKITNNKEQLLKLSEELMNVEKERIAGQSGVTLAQLEHDLNDIIKKAEIDYETNR